MNYGLEHHKCVLVVDDHPAIRDLLSCILSALGDYTVSLAACGTEAWTLVHVNRPDLLLLDYQLPDMTGLQLYDALHAQPNFLPLPSILMSATLPYAELMTRPLITLQKPFRIESVCAALSQAWENSF